MPLNAATPQVSTLYETIHAELSADHFYQQNFPNDGQRFVAWYLRRVLLLDVHQVVASITDGQNDKQIDAIVVDDEERRVRIIQGKFVKPEAIDASPLREVLSAWMRLKDIAQLQLECSGKLAERLETMRVAVQEEYEIEFELLTTGFLTDSAKADFEAFRAKMGEDSDFDAGLTLVNPSVIEARWAEAEQRELPELTAEFELEPERCLITEEANVRTIIALLPLSQCIKLPGITDGKLFRKNVRQNLGINNKVNKALRATLISGEKAPYFFFFHNGVTALCKSFELSDDKRKLRVKDLSVVNGCQSLSTIYATSGKVVDSAANSSLLFRIYEIKQQDLADAISINTNSQSAVKPRDLRSNDRYMKGLKRRYESAIKDGYFVTKRGEQRPADRDEIKTIDATDYARMVVSWQCQRPNLSANEKRLFDEYYKTLFHPELDAQSILALKLWLVEIDKHWAKLDLNEAIKAVRGLAKFHMLFVVSQLFAHASNQSDKVPLPAATMAALPYAGLILGQAMGSMNQALQHAVSQSNHAGKVFSPQNWLKGKGSINDEQLVAGTIVTVLKNMAAPELAPAIGSLKIPADKFSFRWTAE